MPFAGAENVGIDFEREHGPPASSATYFIVLFVSRPRVELSRTGSQELVLALCTVVRPTISVCALIGSAQFPN
jgi:hypothetical protein